MSTRNYGALTKLRKPWVITSDCRNCCSRLYWHFLALFDCSTTDESSLARLFFPFDATRTKGNMQDLAYQYVQFRSQPGDAEWRKVWESGRWKHTTRWLGRWRWSPSSGLLHWRGCYQRLRRSGPRVDDVTGCRRLVLILHWGQKAVHWEESYATAQGRNLGTKL